MIPVDIGHTPDHQFRKEVIGKRVEELWYPRPTRKKVIAKDEAGRQRICRLYQEGYTLRELAEWFLISHENVRTILKEKGIPRRLFKGSWKPPIGMETITNGYVSVYMGKGFPSASQKGWIPKHRLIMQNHLKRVLSPGEVVHHKDRNKLNNEISNLEVLPYENHATCRRCPYYEYYIRKTGNKYFIADLTKKGGYIKI